MSKIIACRIEHCLGCRSCEMACALAHSESKDLRGAVKEHPLPQRRVMVETAGAYGLPLQCRHCEDAPCMMICPSEAIYRETDLGPVLIDADRCIGCKMCIVACPFGVIEFSPDGGVAVKCDQCIERTAAGGDPACVEACPTRALVFVDIDEYNRRKRQAAAQQLQAAEEIGER